MPFTKLVDAHSCSTPRTRDDGSSLVIGDEWRCDKVLRDGSERKCNKLWRWTDSPLESYWSPINDH